MGFLVLSDLSEAVSGFRVVGGVLQLSARAVREQNLAGFAVWRRTPGSVSWAVIALIS